MSNQYACVFRGLTIAGGLILASQAHAVTAFTSLAAWQSAVGGYAETTSLGAPDGSVISGFTTTNGVAVSVTDQVHSIGDGWSTWSGSFTGQILGDYNATSVSYALGSPVAGFGFFVEPDPFDVIDITVTTSNGDVITQPVDGNGGAAFFGWQGAGVTGFTVSASTDFAVGDFFTATGSSAPEPATWAFMLVGFGAMGSTLRKQRGRGRAS